jgi:hypothetical protein
MYLVAVSYTLEHAPGPAEHVQLVVYKKDHSLPLQVVSLQGKANDGGNARVILGLGGLAYIPHTRQGACFLRLKRPELGLKSMNGYPHHQAKLPGGAY